MTNNSDCIMEEYCPICVSYFENIKQHNFDKHDKEMTAFDREKQTYDLPFLKRYRDVIFWELENPNKQSGDSVE